MMKNYQVVPDIRLPHRKRWFDVKQVRQKDPPVRWLHRLTVSAPHAADNLIVYALILVYGQLSEDSRRSLVDVAQPPNQAENPLR